MLSGIGLVDTLALNCCAKSHAPQLIFSMSTVDLPSARDRPVPIGSRQACSLLLLTATLVGSCVALAVRTLLESGSGMLLMLLIIGFMATTLSVVLTMFRKHIRSRR